MELIEKFKLYELLLNNAGFTISGDDFSSVLVRDNNNEPLKMEKIAGSFLFSNAQRKFLFSYYKGIKLFLSNKLKVHQNCQLNNNQFSIAISLDDGSSIVIDIGVSSSGVNTDLLVGTTTGRIYETGGIHGVNEYKLGNFQIKCFIDHVDIHTSDISSFNQKLESDQLISVIIDYLIASSKHVAFLSRQDQERIQEGINFIQPLLVSSIDELYTIFSARRMEFVQALEMEKYIVQHTYDEKMTKIGTKQALLDSFQPKIRKKELEKPQQPQDNN